ncbi:MAG: hypothetical protein GYA17_21785 [Chloroflexi bacterium]|jgi:NTE family protein|nr:patatin-like phospholipase family protein [Anaerolineaceae bacterium]NMB91003.1 hypothetical protein [Chloroflexota bacterium]
MQSLKGYHLYQIFHGHRAPFIAPLPPTLAFVLGGGGARGALQIGAIQALIEAGIRPHLLVGSSIGAVNAAGLALWGLNAAGLQKLVQAWADMAAAGLFDSLHSPVSLWRLLNRPAADPLQGQVRAFLQSHGISPRLKFDDIIGIRLAVVAADLNAGRPIVYSRPSQQPVLEALLASTALMPWFKPIEKDGKYLVDGGALSTLPIETALALGASEVYALELSDLSGSDDPSWGLGRLFGKLAGAVCQRQTDLEIALAEARGVTVHHIVLRGRETVPVWNFNRYQELITTGYELTREHLDHHTTAGRVCPAGLQP